MSLSVVLVMQNCKNRHWGMEVHIQHTLAAIVCIRRIVAMGEVCFYFFGYNTACIFPLVWLLNLLSDIRMLAIKMVQCNNNIDTASRQPPACSMSDISSTVYI